MATRCAARTLVIPMYREASRIEDTVRVLATSSLASADVELIFVDDGSDDRTVEILRSSLAAVHLTGRVLRLERNRGKGAAVKAGVLEAHGQFIAFADADLSAGVGEIERCFELISQGDCDLVFASRGSSESEIAIPQPVMRRLSGKAFNLLVRALRLTVFSDTQCGLKVFTREAAFRLFGELAITSFAFDVEVLFGAHARGMVVREVPITWKHVEASRVDPIKDSARMIRDVVRLRRRENGRVTSGLDGTMPSSRFDVMAKLERDHWWFRAKRDLVAQELRRRGARGTVAVDVGCGTGELAARLGSLPFKSVVGTDLSHYALNLARKEGGLDASLVAARAEQLPLPSGVVSCITSLDVVEHLDDDVAALREYARVVEPGGLIVIAVPAYRWAWSDHDVVLGHRRRYTRRSLLDAAQGAGLAVERCTHYHSWLVPIAFAMRRTSLRHLVRRDPEEASFVSPAVNRCLVLLSAVERAVARLVDVPFGLSIMLVARSPGSPPGGQPMRGFDAAHPGVPHTSD